MEARRVDRLLGVHARRRPRRRSSGRSPSGSGSSRPTRARSRPCRRAARPSAPSSLGTRAPGRWRWKPSGLRSSSPSMLFRWMPVPGHDDAGARAVRAGDRGARRRRRRSPRGGSSSRAARRSRGDRGRARPRREEARRRSRCRCRPSTNSSSRARLVEAITSASARGVAGPVEPLEQLERVGDQDAARRRRRVGQHLAAAEARPDRRALDDLVGGQVVARHQAAALQHPVADRRPRRRRRRGSPGPRRRAGRAGRRARAARAARRRAAAGPSGS